MKNPCTCRGRSTSLRRGVRGCLLLGVAGAIALAYPRVFPTGVTLYDPARAFNTYVFFAPQDDGPGESYLIDMDGNAVHHWDRAGIPPVFLDPAVAGGARGHVLVQLSATAPSSRGPSQPEFFRNKIIGEMDWDGRVVWQWGEQAPGGAARQHHDLHRLANGNTILLSNTTHLVAGFSLPQVTDDVVYEVTPKGEIVWRWTASEHLEEFGFTPQELELVRAAKNPDYLHLNAMTPLGPNHWFEQGDQRFDPQNLLVSSRNANVVVIVEKRTGHIVWKLGPDYPARSQQKLPRPVDQIVGQHNPHLIAPGLPGAGNLLLFDNEGEGGYPPAVMQTNPGSRVLEIDPVKKEIVWAYTGASSDRPEWTFHSSFISSVERLPNGNTFIDEGMNGRFFQVTPAGEIVWEYINPYFKRTTAGAGRALSNAVYRAQPVPYEWAPEGTPHTENAVAAPDPATFRIPTRGQ